MRAGSVSTLERCLEGSLPAVWRMQVVRCHPCLILAGGASTDGRTLCSPGTVCHGVSAFRFREIVRSIEEQLAVNLTDAQIAARQESSDLWAVGLL